MLGTGSSWSTTSPPDVRRTWPTPGQNASSWYASTSEIYGDPLTHPQRESDWGNVDPIGPRSAYDEGKRFAEALTVAYVRERGVDARIARIFNTYGPRMRIGDGRMPAAFIVAAL